MDRTLPCLALALALAGCTSGGAPQKTNTKCSPASPNACPPGEFWLETRGCVRGKACATDGDCLADADPCHTHVTCDAAHAICVYLLLDKDGDGHPPFVCGGDDCDDADPHVHPCAAETCDGKDNDCDGTVDDGASCGSDLYECRAGACRCKPTNSCGGASCIDRDPHNCGACGHSCGANATCTDGACGCAPGYTSCNGGCLDLARDAANCGACGHACAQGASCVGGVCACAGGGSECAGACVDLLTDAANCGACGNACNVGVACAAGQCQLGCNDLLLCTNACMDQSCWDGCVKRGSPTGANDWNALMSCLVAACPSQNANDPCYTPNSQTCSSCWSAAQMPGGKCRTQLTTCQNN